MTRVTRQSSRLAKKSGASATHSAASSSKPATPAKPSARVPCPHSECRGKLFDRYGGLNRHLNNTHGAEVRSKRHKSGEYQCPHCDHVATQQTNLGVHIRSLHTGEQYPCPHCPWGSPDKGALLRHVQKTHGDNEFSTRGLLLRGQSADDVPEKLKCGFCLYKGRTEHELAAHTRARHTGERFACPDCGMQSAREHALLKHARMVHRSDFSAADLLIVPGHNGTTSERGTQDGASDDASRTPNLLSMGFGSSSQAAPATADPFQASAPVEQTEQVSDAVPPTGEVEMLLEMPHNHYGPYEATIDPWLLNYGNSQTDAPNSEDIDTFLAADISLGSGEHITNTVSGFTDLLDSSIPFTEGTDLSNSTAAATDMPNLLTFTDSDWQRAIAADFDMNNMFDFNQASGSDTLQPQNINTSDSFESASGPDLDMTDSVDPLPDFENWFEPVQGEFDPDLSADVCPDCVYDPVHDGHCIFHL